MMGLKSVSFDMTQGNSKISKDIPPYCIASRLNRLVGVMSSG